MTMLQVFVQVVLVALGLCKLYIILYRMVKAAQLTLGGFFSLYMLAYRTKSVCENPYNTRYLLVL